MTAMECGWSLPDIQPQVFCQWYILTFKLYFQDPSLSKEEQWRAALVEQEKFRVIWLEEAKQRGLTFPSDSQGPIFDSKLMILQ